MTTEQRLNHLENTSDAHNRMIGLLIDIGARQQETLDDIKDLLKEVQRDSHQTQRLWVRLAQRHGWLEDDDLLDGPDDNG